MERKPTRQELLAAAEPDEQVVVFALEIVLKVGGLGCQGVQGLAQGAIVAAQPGECLSRNAIRRRNEHLAEHPVEGAAASIFFGEFHPDPRVGDRGGCGHLGAISSLSSFPPLGGRFSCDSSSVHGPCPH